MKLREDLSDENKATIVVVILAFFLAVSELLIKRAYEILELSSISALIKYIFKFDLATISLIGIGFFITSWSLAIIVRILLSLPYSKVDAKKIIPLYRLSVIVSSLLLGIIILREFVSVIRIIGIFFSVLAMYYFYKSK